MNDCGHSLFDTAIGRCGIAWRDAVIAGVQLPEANDTATRRRLLRRMLDARERPPPTDVEAAIAGITALLRGESIDLSTVRLDMDDIPALGRRVYEIARTIPPGATLSYGEVAARIGDRALARDVGEALGHNPFAIVVPCHRVLTADGRLGGFSANGGIETKLRILAIEGARIGDAPTLFGDLPLAARPRRR